MWYGASGVATHPSGTAALSVNVAVAPVDVEDWDYDIITDITPELVLTSHSELRPEQDRRLALAKSQQN